MLPRVLRIHSSCGNVNLLREMEIHCCHWNYTFGKKKVDMDHPPPPQPPNHSFIHYKLTTWPSIAPLVSQRPHPVNPAKRNFLTFLRANITLGIRRTQQVESLPTCALRHRLIHHNTFHKVKTSSSSSPIKTLAPCGPRMLPRMIEGQGFSCDSRAHVTIARCLE